MTEIRQDKPEPQSRDIRKSPFAWQDMRSTRLVRESFSDKKRTTAIAIYQAFTECASEVGRVKGRHVSTFAAPLVRIAAKSGKSVSTVKRYAGTFRTLGLLSWEIRRQGKTNLPNLWTLLAPSLHNRGGRYTQHSELVRGVHNSELAIEEKRRIFISKKGKSSDFRSTEGAEHIGDLIKRRRGV